MEDTLLLYAMLYVHPEAVEHLVWRFWRSGSYSVPFGLGRLVQELGRRVPVRLRHRVIGVRFAGADEARVEVSTTVEEGRRTWRVGAVVWAGCKVAAQLHSPAAGLLRSQRQRCVRATVLRRARLPTSARQDVRFRAGRRGGPILCRHENRPSAEQEEDVVTVFQGADRSAFRAEHRRAWQESFPEARQVCTRLWKDVFPHWGPGHAKKYFALQAMQGLHRQWYVGGFATFEAVEPILTHAAWVVNQVEAHLVRSP